MKQFFFLLVLLSARAAHAQVAPCTVPTPCGNVSLSPQQARLIDRTLSRHERLKQAYLEKVEAGRAKDEQLAEKDIEIQIQDSSLASYERSIWTETRLRLTAQTQATTAKNKARRRGWLVAGLAVLTVLLAVK